jgi:xanthine dehydrogenase large subunit
MKNNLSKVPPHDSAQTHVTGQSVFIDDRPQLNQEVHVGILKSNFAFGKILKIDWTEAQKDEDFLASFEAHDFHENQWGTIKKDQPLLANQTVNYFGEPVALVASKNKFSLQRILSKAKIHSQIETPLLNLDEAIQKEVFLYKARPFITGEIDSALKQSDHTLKGSLEIGGQEHFYMENQAAVAYPLENGQIEIHSSSQHSTETQHVVAHGLGIDLKDVVCIVKRMGGGFGGKESQAAPIAAYASLVAAKLNKAARINLSKDDDMQITGKRHPFKIHYELGFSKDGLIQALKVKLYADGGAYTDLSPSILDRAMFHVDGCYFIPNTYIEGFVCKTNHHSNTAFRGFGGPQGTFVIESLLEDMAQVLKKDSAEIRILNLYKNKQQTPYGQNLDKQFLSPIFKQLLKSSDYKKRALEIKKFNQSQGDTLRGISITGTKFGIAFTALHLNQGNALVNIHRDGTVQVSTGATEMGQGVNTKIQQVVAKAFEISCHQVRVMPTSTEKNHNTSPTAASSGSDLNCAAALKAADLLKQRLLWVAYHHFNKEKIHHSGEIPQVPLVLKKEIIKSLENYFLSEGFICQKNSDLKLSFQEAIELCYFNRISLGEYAHFKTEGIGFDKNTGKGQPFKYFTQGAAVSEVEIDLYTGALKVLRTDILMDIGKPINEGIDRGQITGAFIQGMGWVTTEKLVYNKEGKLLTHSPTTYKIPNIQDTPRIFNIALFKNETNTENVFKSKAVGEPPLLLGISVWTAIKKALYSKSKGEILNLKSPATGEIILEELTKYGAPEF